MLYDDDTMTREFEALREIQEREDFETVWSAWELCTAERMGQQIQTEATAGMTLSFEYWDLNFQDQEVTVRLPAYTITWLDLWRACDQLIRSTGDFHTFIEGFEVVDTHKIRIIAGS